MTEARPVRRGESGAVCPVCSATTVGVVGEPPWCPACEWHLGAIGESRGAGRSRQIRRSFLRDDQLFDELSGRIPGRPGWSPRLLTVSAISFLLGAATLSLLAFGVVMVVVASWPVKIVGLVVIVLAVQLRPRLPALPVTPGIRTRNDAPTLFAVLDTVAEAIDAPSVRVVVLDDAFDASCGRYGLRRRRVLVLGLPLWAALAPEGRVALLSHQLAHLVDGDLAQRLLIQPALSTLGNLATSFGPRRARPRPMDTADVQTGVIYSDSGDSSIGSRMDLFEGGVGIAAAVATPFRWVFSKAQGGLQRATAQEQQRAEYYADALALDVAGTIGMIGYLQALLLNEPVSTTVRRCLRVGADVQTVRAAAADTIAAQAEHIRLREQRSMRDESSVSAAHPPTGRRLRMVQSWPTTDGRLASTALDFASVDAEMDADYRRVARTLGHVA